MLAVARRAALVLGVVLAPSLVFAQSGVAGVVKDTSGAVLPGVTVEASSPALIEKVRSAVTDDSGQYRIINLQPGRYAVSFTLPGFAVFKREDVEIPNDFVANINADMRVGGLQETITVTGESPVVDITSARRTRTLDNELVQSLPTAKGYAGIMLLIPSMTVGSGAPQQVQLSPGMIVFGGRGGRTNEGRVQVDGLNTGASLNGGGVSGYRQDIENSAEISMTTSGGLGEAEVGGPAMNIIPRTGGNTFTGHFFGTGLNSSMQSDNFTERVIAAGLTRPNRINYNYDTSLSSGGPVIKDRLWYYGLVYYRGSGNDINMFHNQNAGDVTKWTYVRADLLNALNTDAILNYNQAYSPTTTWPVATSVLTARSTKITVQWDF